MPHDPEEEEEEENTEEEEESSYPEPDDFEYIEDDDFYDPEKGYIVNPDDLDFDDRGFSEEYLEEYQVGAYDPETQLEHARQLNRKREHAAQERRNKRREEIYREGVIDRVTAEIGDLTFHDEFANPDVDVQHDRQTAEHEIVSAYHQSGEEVQYVVQTMGRHPPEITVTGWISEDQLETLDSLISSSTVEVVTDRWTGVAVPININTPYERAFHEDHGRVFEVTIELLGISKELPDNTINKWRPREFGFGT